MANTVHRNQSIKFQPILIDLITFFSPWIMILMVRDLIEFFDTRSSISSSMLNSKTYQVSRYILGDNALSSGFAILLLSGYLTTSVLICFYLITFYSVCFYQSTSPRWRVVSGFLRQMM